MAGEASIVRLINVDKVFDDQRVVRNLNLDIATGEFLTLLGPSGCGKTTTLRMIAGFEEPTSGEVLIEGASANNLPPYKRNVNTVFQSYALFPHMNVYDNIAFGLVEKKVKKAEIRRRVNEMLSLIQLTGFERRMPAQMSGGQRQRVAIARALVNNPKVLLLDEPLGALDLKLRKQMQVELKHLQRQLGITFVYVTHDQEEALTMSDRIGVMNEGVLEQVGTPSEIYERPTSKFVASFIGESNILEAAVEHIDGDKLTLTLEFGKATARGKDFVYDEMVYVSIRPEKVKYSTEPVEGFSIFGVVKEHIYIGSIIKTVIELPTEQQIIVTRQPDQSLLAVGEHIWLYWDVGSAVVMHTPEDPIYNIIEEHSFLGEIEGL
ncbi:MAG TPA: ABC transporter ATP-binding protein [Oscillospiraceae bacterium]|nr:ABC transporter ATP-binding protein [Oscillospiraceae bacterium]